MTVCVVASGFYQAPEVNGVWPPVTPVVAFAADRMITVGQGVREFEQSNTTKAFFFTERMMALISGDGEELLEVLKRSWVRAKADNVQHVRALADIVADEFRSERASLHEDSVLNGKWKLTWDQFYAREARMSDDLRSRIIREVEWVEPLGSLIVAGVDDSYGAWSSSIYEVTDPGKVWPCNQAGYRAIGIGREHAEAVFMDAGYTPNTYWELAVLLTYEAKRRGELAAGVGQVTDIWWVTPDGPRQYYGPGTPFLTGLDRIYKRRDAREQKAMLADRISLSKLLKEMRGDSTEVKDESQADPETSAPDEAGVSAVPSEDTPEDGD